MTQRAPPRLASRMLELVVPERNREVIIGDLAEEYALRIGLDEGSSPKRWYWGQVMRSTPRLAWTGLAGASWHTTIGIALCAFVAASLIEAGATFAIAKNVPLGSQAYLLTNSVIGLGAMTMGGYWTARIRPAAATLFAWIVLGFVAILMVVESDSAPLWYHLLFLVLGPGAVLAGRNLHLRTASKMR